MPFEHATPGPHLGEVFVPLKGERKDRASNAFAELGEHVCVSLSRKSL